MSEASPLATTGVVSVQLVAPLFDVGRGAAPPECEAVNESATPLLGWAVSPITVVVVARAAVGADVEAAGLIIVGEDVTGLARFDAAISRLTAAEGCVRGQGSAQERTGLTLSEFHHAAPACRDGQTLFVLGAGKLATKPGAVDEACRAAATRVTELRAAGLSPSDDGEGLPAASAHAGLLLLAAGRAWSLTVVAGAAFETALPPPEFPLVARLAALAGVAAAAALLLGLISQRQRAAAAMTLAETIGVRRRAEKAAAVASVAAHTSTLRHVAHEVRPT